MQHRITECHQHSVTVSLLHAVTKCLPHTVTLCLPHIIAVCLGPCCVSNRVFAAQCYKRPAAPQYLRQCVIGCLHHSITLCQLHCVTGCQRDRSVTLRRQGLASLEGVPSGPGVCMSNGNAGPSAKLSGMPSLPHFLRPSLGVKVVQGQGCRRSRLSVSLCSCDAVQVAFCVAVLPALCNDVQLALCDAVPQTPCHTVQHALCDAVQQARCHTAAPLSHCAASSLSRTAACTLPHGAAGILTQCSVGSLSCTTSRHAVVLHSMHFATPCYGLTVTRCYSHIVTL